MYAVTIVFDCPKHGMETDHFGPFTWADAMKEAQEIRLADLLGIAPVDFVAIVPAN